MVRQNAKHYGVKCLYDEGVPMTVSQITDVTDYSHEYQRERLREAKKNDEIEGAKLDPVTACSVRGQTIVLTSDFQGMMDDLKTADKALADRAKRDVTHGDINGLQKFIKRHATSTYTIEYRWKFWYPTATPPAGASPSPAAPAAD